MGRTGVWLIGAQGSLASTVVTGARAIARGLAGRGALVTELPELRGLAFVGFEDLVFGGWDIAPTGLLARARAMEIDDRALPFYTGRRIVVVNGTRGDLDLASRLPEASGYFVDAGEFQGLWGGDRRVFLVTQRRGAASIATDLPTESVHLIGCFGSRCLYSNRGN